MTSVEATGVETQRINPHVARAASYSWRFLVIAAALAVVVWLLGQLVVVVLSLAVALLLTRALIGPTKWLEARGLPRTLSAAVALVVTILLIVALVGLVGVSLATEFDQLGTTVSEGIDDIETWLVDDSPFDIDRARLSDFRDDAASRISTVVSSSDGAIVQTAVLALETVSGILLALIVTFFLLKDREQLVGFGLRTARADRRPTVVALGERAWSTLGGYLRGVGLLGVVEATIIGFTVWIVGGGLVGAVVVVTLLGAFVPIVGAIVAGAVAVLVTLVTAGATPAIIVLVVALVVQQLDNDLLAPVIYGKSLRLHPLVILLGIAGGTTLFGFVGAVLAVPVISVVLNMVDEARHPPIEQVSAQE